MPRGIPVVMPNYSTFLFNVIIRSCNTLEYKIMIDLAATQDAYNRKEIEEIGLVRTANNIADAFAKQGNNNTLQKFTSPGCSEQVVSKWVVCDEVGEKQKNN